MLATLGIVQLSYEGGGGAARVATTTNNLQCVTYRAKNCMTKRNELQNIVNKMEIVGAVKTYDWGKLGASSEVAKLAALNAVEFQENNETAYAELWMGDHPSGPATLKTNGKQLGAVLSDRLPFLFKVLSIRKALSIQVHPNKSEAERLHLERPDIYKDPNHKPELAIALTPFTALCGFRPYAEIVEFCEQLPPLRALLGNALNVDELKNGDHAALKQCYTALMTADESATTKCINEIAGNYEQVLVSHNLLDVFCAINSDFPHDVGLLSLFFLNLLRLQPGQAIFLAANEIHAYLSGDCIECMACSDNVIRAGLTPKYKDVKQLISCLNYAGLPPTRKLFQPHTIDAHVQIFVPPVEDFAVTTLSLQAAVTEYKLQLQPYASILLVLQGERSLRLSIEGVLTKIPLKRGSIIFIPAAAAPEIEFVGHGANKVDFKAYMAMYNYFKN